MKSLIWVGSSLRDLRTLPDRVKRAVGYSLYLAQEGKTHPHAKPLSGFGGAGVIEVVEDYSGNTYRAVYTVRFVSGIYVLHVFQKKAKHGIATPRPDMDLIRKRLQQAQGIDAAARKGDGA